METKQCKRCLETKELTEFRSNKHKSKCRHICRNCERLISRLWKKNNSDQNNEITKEWRKNNTAHIKKYEKQYKEDNKERNNKQKNEYDKNRRNTDPAYKLRHYTSVSIGAALKLNGSSKNGLSCTKYLPYTIQELKKHLEKQFEPWMNWNNRGKYNPKTWNNNDPTTWTWQVDHIVPQSDLLFTSMTDDNFVKCWALSNLRPLSAKQNALDGFSKVRHKKPIYLPFSE